MADTKISNATNTAPFAATDMLPLARVSDTTARKITVANLLTNLHRAYTFVVAANNASAKVKAAADYVCDGTADESEINTALAAMPSTGGVLRLSEGTFNIASSILVQQDSTTIIGAGVGGRVAAAQVGRGTFLKGATGLTTALLKVQNAADNVPVYGVTLRDFNVDGNAIGTGVDGILFKSNQALIDHVYVHGCTGEGIQLEAYLGWELYDTVVSHCISSHNTGSGLFLNTYAADTRVLDCTLLTNTGSGLRIKAGGVQVVGGQFYNNDYNILFDGGGSQCMISAVKIENSGREGIYFDATTTGIEYVVISGCGFRYNGKSASNTYAHIGGTGNQQCSNVMITGNRFDGRPLLSPDNKGKYGIDMWNSSGPKYWGVFGNVFAQPIANHFGTDAVRNSGTSCKVRGNQGAPDSGLMGTGTITAALKVVTVTHGLPYTPTAVEITIIPTNDPTADVGSVFVNNLTSTTFDVNVHAAPGVNTFTFAWRVG